MDFLFQLLFSPLPTSAVISLLALAAATLLYLNTRPGPVRSPFDLHCQSLGIKVGGDELLLELWASTRLMFISEVYTVLFCPQDGARKSALLEDNNNLMSHYFDDARTLYEVFQRGLKVSGAENFCLLLVLTICWGTLQPEMCPLLAPTCCDSVKRQ